MNTRITTMIMALAVIFFLSACSKKATFPVSSIVPAAEGYVKVKQDKNDNYEIKVEVKYLANPGRLNPPKDMYVVWENTVSSGIENLGRLNISRSLLSDVRKGSLETVSSYKRKAVFITAEDRSDTQYPSRQEVLRTEID